MKKKIISAAAVLWRQFKNKLTTVHIKPHKNSPEKLKYTPDEYVSQSVWEQFVKARMTDEFEVIFLYEMNKYIYYTLCYTKLHLFNYYFYIILLDLFCQLSRNLATFKAKDVQEMNIITGVLVRDMEE